MLNDNMSFRWLCCWGLAWLQRFDHTKQSKWSARFEVLTAVQKIKFSGIWHLVYV